MPVAGGVRVAPLDASLYADAMPVSVTLERSPAQPIVSRACIDVGFGVRAVSTTRRRFARRRSDCRRQFPEPARDLLLEWANAGRGRRLRRASEWWTDMRYDSYEPMTLLSRGRGCHRPGSDS